MSGSPDIVVLRTDKGTPSLPLLRVVIGGVASQQDLLVDQLDDVQLAVETLVAEESPDSGELVLEIAAGGSGLSLTLDGLSNQSVKQALVAPGPFRPSEDCPLDVRMLLESLVDVFKVLERAEGRFAIQLEKWTS